MDGRSPTEDFLAIKEELRLHNANLIERPSVVVANKMDLPESQSHLREFTSDTGIEPLVISALKKDGISDLKKAIHALSTAKNAKTAP